MDHRPVISRPVIGVALCLALCLAIGPGLRVVVGQPAPETFPTQWTISDVGPHADAARTKLGEASRVLPQDPQRDHQVGTRGDVVVVCPPQWLPTLAPWVEHRQRQGYRVLQVDARLSSAEILGKIRAYPHRDQLRGIVLVGDGDLTMREHREIRERCVPPFFVRATINASLGAEDHVATDNPYGDLDGDGVADVPVGRLSVDSAHQLARWIERIKAYEADPHLGDWAHTIHLSAAVGEFGVLTDALIETAAKKFLAEGIPPAFRTTMTYGNWRSPFCPDPRAFRDVLLGQVDKGCLFWVYMGHGHPHRLDRFQVGEAVVPVLEAGDVARFRSRAGAPIAVLLACYAGAFDQPEDCLAERLVRNEMGPVAAFAASRITMPYSMAILGNALMEAYFQRGATTLGEVILEGKRELAKESAEARHRKLLDSLAKTLSPTKEQLPLERAEHQQLFNLLGDPLLTLPRPHAISMHCPSSIRAGDRLIVRGSAPFQGSCVAEIVCRRDRLTFTPPRRRSPAESEEGRHAMTEIYRRANDDRWYHRRFPMESGKFAVELHVPDGGPGAKSRPLRSVW